MIRRFNYTDRIRIKRSDIEITLLDQDGEHWFDAELSGLANYDIPRDGLVFVEAYRQTNWMRFAFGTVGDVTPPQNLHLVQFGSPEGILFRIKVTAAGDVHKLLAQADAIPLFMPEQEEGGREPLLVVIPSKELGDEIYRVDFSNDRPVLLINMEVGNVEEMGRSSEFRSLVYPAVFREILTRIIIIDKYNDEEDMNDWRSRWIKFMMQLPVIGEQPAIDDEEGCLDWIQNAVAEFARKQKTRRKFAEFWRDEQ